MKYYTRVLESEILRALEHFSAILLTGPRRSGKTTLLRHLFPSADYVLLEDPDVIARVKNDPHGFLDSLKLPVILDEIQNTPLLLNYVRSRIDQSPALKGKWLLTGSQEAPLMQGVSESMAGRAALFSLLPFSVEENSAVSLLRGGFPEVLQSPNVADIWFRSYIQTYLERDVRLIAAIQDLAMFRRFLGLLASRCGQMLNKTALAAPLGITVPTITKWLDILEITGQVIIVPQFFENFGKRLIKTPKLYFTDSGLAAALLGIRTKDDLLNSPFKGALFEGLVASEIVKQRLNRGLERNLYTFRDRQGWELDFVVLHDASHLSLLEVKATATPMPGDANQLKKATSFMSANYQISSYLVHAGENRYIAPMPLAKGVTAVSWRNFKVY